MRIYLKLLCGLLVVALACVLFPVSTPAASQGGGQLIIQRAANLGTDLSLNVWVDGKQVARLGLGQTYNGSLSPGPHVVTALVVPNRMALDPTKMSLNVVAGKTYRFTAMWQAEQLVLL